MLKTMTRDRRGILQKALVWVLALSLSSSGLPAAAVPVRARVIVHTPIAVPYGFAPPVKLSLTGSGLIVPDSSLFLPSQQALILSGAQLPVQASSKRETLYATIRLLHKDAGRRGLLDKIVRARLQNGGASGGTTLGSLRSDLDRLYDAASHAKKTPLSRVPSDALPVKARSTLRELEAELARPRPSYRNAYWHLDHLRPSEENPLTAGQQRRLAEKLLELLPKAPRDLSYWQVDLIENLGRSSSEAYEAVMDGFIRTYSRKFYSWTRFEISRRLISAAEHSEFRAVLLRTLSRRLGFNAADPKLHLALVGRLPRSSFDDAELIMTTLGVLSAGNPALRKSIETEIVKRTFEDRSRRLPNLKPVRGGGLWFKGQKARVRKEMPTLMAVLEDPDAAGRFLSTLAYLRMLDPYYKANRAFKPTLQWAREHGKLIALNELRIVPVSESFRRMLITNESGSLTLEIKFPGQMGDRMRLHNKEFLIAQWLWRNFPDDPGVVKPVYTGRLTGKLRLYGKIKKFLPEKPLVFTIFEYEDGKRFSNAGNMLSAIARRLRTTKKRLIHKIRVDMAVTVIRLHRAGWLGSVKGNDMHPENIKVLRDGRGVLVADFLAFTRHRNPSLKARQGDLRGILSDYLVERDPAGSEPERYEPAKDDRMEAIYADVVARLTRGVRSRTRREEIAEEVRREFALKRTPGNARPPRLLIVGPPGSGKSTQAKRLAKEFGVVHITVGGLLREYAKAHPEILERMNTGKLVDTKLVLRLVRERLAQDDVKRQGFILDGFPRRKVEADRLDELVGEEDTIDGMIRLEVPEEELLRRILKRGRADDNEAVFQERMRIYREETVPVIERFAANVPVLEPKSAAGAVGRIYGEIVSGLRKLLRRTGS